MGITRMNLSHFEEAIGNFEQQLKCLEEGTVKVLTIVQLKMMTHYSYRVQQRRKLGPMGT